MSDWYLARQIEYFRQGRRGGHPDDLYGNQIARMAAVLSFDEAVADVVAYIATLPPSRRARYRHAGEPGELSDGAACLR